MRWNGIEDAHSDNDPREQQGQGRAERKTSPLHSRNRTLARSESKYPEVSRLIGFHWALPCARNLRPTTVRSVLASPRSRDVQLSYYLRRR